MSERDPMRDQWDMLANDPVVWVDDATPFTAEQVQELLIDNARLSAELARLRAANEALAGALHHWVDNGLHLPFCSRGTYVGGITMPCDCGLLDARAALTEHAAADGHAAGEGGGEVG